MAVVNEVGYNMEKIIHGDPSGVDNSVATYGGAITFENGQIQQLPGLVCLYYFTNLGDFN